MLFLFLCLLVTFGGACMWAFSSQPKISEMGRILFFWGVYFLMGVFAVMLAKH